MGLYLTTAAIVRRSELEVFETDGNDVEFICDAPVRLPKADFKRVRMIVKQIA